MRSTPRLRIVVAALALAVVAAGCSSTKSNNNSSATNAPKRGGILRIGLSGFGFTANLDPTADYASWTIDGALVRTLVSYTHTAGSAGNQPHPDLASGMPTISDGGLTYTFHLKSNIKFAPPVSREITSQDIEYAFERLNDKNLAAQYGFYFNGVVVGMTGQVNGLKPVSGIQTPNPTTVIFHLSHPTGDFVYRLTLPGTGPIPSEVARCFTQASTYGPFLVASGPYMIEGAQNLNIHQSCAQMAKHPYSGYSSTSFLHLVRNPNYVQSTDNLRSNYVNGIDFTVDTNVGDIFNRIESGDLDSSYFDQPPPATLLHYLTSPTLKKQVHVNTDDLTAYVSMNLTTPPFDDVHVRKAVNYILDKAAIQKAWGGAISGPVATHIIPDDLLGSAPLGGYNPYATPGNAGSLTLAKQQMMLSKYDPKHDGMCDVSACKNVLFINKNIPPWTTMEPIVVADLAKIGIQLVPRELAVSQETLSLGNVSAKVPIGLSWWSKDYPDPYTFAYPLFGGTAISAQGSRNFALVGLTAAQAKAFGIPYPAGGVPSVDTQIQACEVIPSGSSRSTCWANLDKTLMTSVVPWVPFSWPTLLTITGPTVTHFQFDQFGAEISLTQTAVNNNLPVSSMG